MVHQSHIHRKTFLKQFVIIFLPFVILVALLSWAVYYFQIVKTQEAVLKAKEINSLILQKEFIQQTIQSIISDIKVIVSDQAFQSSLNREAKHSETHVTSDFLIFSKYKGIYDQIRLLDHTGMEIIRVDLKGDRPYPVPADQLQFKGRRYYFKDTYRLEKGEIFMSPLDLNVEKGKIEMPFKPMIRFGTPVFDKNGVKQGVLLLNYLGKKMIDDLVRLSLDSPGRLMLLNSQGYYLKGMTAEDEWGFMLDDRSEKKIQNQYPGLWQKINENEKGQLFIRGNLVSFVKIFPLKEGIKSSSGSPKPFQESDTVLNPDQFFWVIVSHVPKDQLHRENNRFVFSLILTDVMLIILIGAFSWLLVLANTRRRLAEDALKKSNLELEEKVKTRTKELFDANRALEKEVMEHRKAVSEKQKIESQLRQAQKMEAIGTLAGGIAHDFNNILTPILGYAEITMLQIEKDSPIRKDMNEIISASHRAKELVQQILTFSRQTEHELRPVKAQLVIKEAVKLLKSTIPSTIEIRTEIKSDCSPVLADHTQIHQIIMNLCTNAYHSMRENGGTLQVSLFQVNIGPENNQTETPLKPGLYIKLEVSDTGCGMTKEVQEKIFEPYFTTKEEGEGTGLGLSVVHGIVKSLNGHIAVYSEPGKGTRFHIYLPAVESQTEFQKPAVKEDIPHGTGKILLVDDEKSIVKLEKQILEDLGYSVTEQTSSREALKLFKENPDAFDLVITDMTMPKMNGAELIRHLNVIRPGIPTILCTGFTALFNPETDKDIGCSSHLTKPIALMDLAKTVRDVLDKNKSL